MIHLRTSTAIEFKDVHYSVRGRTILAGINLAIPAHRVTAIMGPSGTGKTTLLRLMTGDLSPDRGVIFVEGQELASLRKRELFRLRLRMGVLLQQGALFSDLDVFENVAFPLREQTDLQEDLIRLVVLLKLNAVGLRGAARLMPAELSGGMTRRVALARAVALDPPLLLCDEPFTGLDPISVGVVVRLLRTLTDSLKLTTVIVSHDVAEVEALADMSCILSEGAIAASGRPRDLRRSPSEAVSQFLNGAADGPIPFHYPAPEYYRQLLERD